MATAYDGLFGPSAEEVRQQQYAGAQQRGFDWARMAPLERANAAMYQGGYGMMDTFAPAAGVKNPAVERARRNEQIMAEGDADLGTSAGMAAKAEQFRQAGDLRTATVLTIKAREMKRQEEAAALAGRKQDFQENQMFDLKKQQLAQTAESARQRSEDMRYSVDQRAEAAKEAVAARMQLAQLVAATRSQGGPSVAQQRLDWQKEQADEKARAKAEINEAKNVRTNALMGEGAKNVLGIVSDAKKLVGMNTAGFGSILAKLPATDARALESKLNTIKANLGFDRLQQMRDASPTGGALGAIAVKELEALQQTVSSLDQGLSGEELTKSLNAIEGHYNRWVNATKAAGGSPETPQSPTVPVDFNTKWATLKSGQSLVGPDGKTYTKK